MQRSLIFLTGLLLAATAHGELRLSERLGEAGAKREELRRIPGSQPRAPKPESAPLPDPNRNSGLRPVTPVARHGARGERVPVPDRWRIVEDLGLIPSQLLDPYGQQNPLKGDVPLTDDGWFLQLTVISDTVVEPRRLPTPVGPQSTSNAGSLDIFGGDRQLLLAETVIASLAWIRGNTTFKPPDWEWRITPVVNINYTESDERRALRIDPGEGRNRGDEHLGLQEAFVDYHIRNVSVRYDFDSLRFGIQPLNLDFRGFLFQDNPLAFRLFGTRANNVFQYNLIWARRLEKDTNSGLNDVGRELRDDDLIAANLYWQDFPTLGFFSQLVLAHNINREDDGLFFDRNGFLGRPASIGNEQGRNYRVTYLGYNGDGHFGRLNLTASTYLAVGRQSRGVFDDRPQDVLAGFGALEASVDYSWIRPRLSLLYATGDRDPFDGEANGFDAVFENPVFAGADTSFWIRQAVPLIGGGGVALSTRNGVLNNLRQSKEHGQSNFDNPGTVLAGIGADFDLTPETRLSFNANQLWFADTAVLETARNQAPIGRGIGTDLSLALIHRPFMSQNVVLRLSGAMLETQSGFEQLFDVKRPFSILFNAVLTY